jgi:hypothetical protein
MIQILRFHRTLYIATGFGVAAAFFAARWIPAMVWVGAPASFWMVASLVVSWYVYDCSPLTRYEWLPAHLLRRPARWLNLHAGIDEATAPLSRLLPASYGRSLDIFDAREMTEASIHEARRVTGAREPQPINWAKLRPQDAVFLIFTAHEIRWPDSRVRLFRRAAAVLSAGGEIAVVEHVRDWLNFLAFGPGFWHFLPLRTWRATAAAAGLRIREEFSITPFVRVFLMEKSI